MPKKIIELDSQKDIAMDICAKIVEFGKSKDNLIYIVNLIGEKGCGKSTIVDSVTANLPVGWNVNKIVGTENDTLSNAAVEVGTITEFYLLPSLSLKYDIATCGISLRFQEADRIFNDIQRKFIKNVVRDNNPRVIVVENFHDLDDVSRKFVKTLWNEDLYASNYKKKFSRVAKGPIVFFITSDIPIKNATVTFDVSKINISELKKLSNECYKLQLTDDQAKQIAVVTGGNIKFINCILKANGQLLEHSLDQIIETRIKEISEACNISNTKTIEKICTYGAYFEQGFTADYLVKLFDNLTHDDIYEIFSKLQDFGFIEGNTEYKYYTAEKLKKAFIERKINLQQLYFRSMYMFYTKYYDYQYATRLKFLYNLYLLEQSETYKDKLIALTFLDICTKIYNRSISGLNEVDDYLQEYDQITMPRELVNILYNLVNNSLKYNQVQNLLTRQFDILVIAEMHRLLLNLISGEKLPTSNVNALIKQSIQVSERLENLKSMEEDQHEKYERLVLQDAIITQLINRSTLSEIIEQQKKRYESFLESFATINKEIYYEYLNRYKRKACLYECCDCSLQYLNDAQAYFEKNKNLNELQKVYTNQLGLYCVMSRVHTKECKKLHNDLVKFMGAEKNAKFADIYKYHHNLLLYKFMSIASTCTKDEEYVQVAQNICKDYEKLYKQYQKNLLRLNLVSLTCIFDIEKAKNMTDEFLIDLAKVQNFDRFYIYHLYNYKIMFCIMDKDWNAAQKLLDSLETKTFPIFNDAEENYKERLGAFELIIQNKVCCKGILEYDRLIFEVLKSGQFAPRYFYGKDESWKFYAKSFLLTDAQYFD